MSICDDARKKGTEKIKAAYLPLIDEIARIIKNMQSKGLDPRKYYDAKKDQVVDLVALLNDLGKTCNDQIKELNNAVDRDCQQHIDFIQSIMDMAVVFITKGLSKVLPKHITHIDVGEIISGKPLGGDNSIFNQIRDGVFNSIGMGKNNDLRRVVSDPINTVKDSVNDALKKSGLPFRL